MKFKAIIFIFCLFSSLNMYSQYAIENYTNANIEQISEMTEIADWIHFNSSESIYPFLSKNTSVDLEFLRIESNFMSKEYPRSKITTNKDIAINDNRTIIWYERNIYKTSKNKLKARYQIYFTIEYVNGSYQIIDLRFGKKKKIKTDNYTKN